MIADLQDSSPLLRVEHLTKTFGNLVANDNICFDIRKGEIHCLLGENGAGKSTISECLYGFYRPDSGHITFKDKTLVLNSPRDAINSGIGMVHQHFILATPMSVVENIVVGTEIPGIKLDLKSAAEKIRTLCREYDLDLDPYARISTLSVGQQQWVEILKALYVGIELLILDEPTAVLTPQESDKLFSILKKMTRTGLSILLITHKLYEVLNMSDRVTVLRKGKLIATVNTSETNRHDLACMMVGREVNFKVDKEPLPPGDTLLRIEDLHLVRENGVPALDGFSLTVCGSQILGLAGVAGNGQKELYDVIVGVQNPSRGKILLEGKDITGRTPLEINHQGLAGIPPDRINEGLIMDFSVKENLILGMHHSKSFQKYGLFNPGAVDRFADQSVNGFDIALQSADQPVRRLSGGNLQKVILARELSQAPRVVVASSPTRGLDVGAMEFVYSRLIELRSRGAAILLISEDLDEIFNVADVIGVIFKGRIVGVCRVEETTKDQIGLLMAGIHEASHV